MNAPDFTKGERVTEPGIYSGIHIDRYHEDICAGPSISSSGLRTIFHKSPAHYFLASPYNTGKDENGEPLRQFVKPTESMILGRAAHHLLLEETGFRKMYIVRPARLLGEPWQGNRTVCKNWIAEHESKGLIVLKDEQIAVIRGMRDSLAREPLIKAGILRGRVEQSLFTRDPATKIWLKARPDAIPSDADDFADLKTAADVDFESLERAIDDFGYYIQAAVVALCWHALTGRKIRSFNLVFVESKAPYCVAIVEIKPSEIERGVEDASLALKVFAHCLKTGEWFGPAGHTSDAKPIGRKPWALDNAKFRYKVLEQEIAKWTKIQTPPTRLA